MFTRLLIVLSLLSTVLVAQPAYALRGNVSRQEIKTMPLQERPNRVGHIYGNTVRRSTRPASATD